MKLDLGYRGDAGLWLAWFAAKDWDNLGDTTLRAPESHEQGPL